MAASTVGDGGIPPTSSMAIVTPTMTPSAAETLSTEEVISKVCKRKGYYTIVL